MYGIIGSLVGSGLSAASNIFTNIQNQKNFNTNRNDVLKNNFAANTMLQNYMNGNNLLSGMTNNISINSPFGKLNMPNPFLQSDLLNPFLALNSQKLQEKSMKLNEEQFKFSQYVTENSAQIKSKDYEKAGFSPLLAVGGGAAYSPVSTGSSGATSSKSQSAMQNSVTQSPMNFLLNTGLAKELAEIDVLKAQKGKINAETQTELTRPSNINADTKLKGVQTAKVNKEVSYIQEQITTELERQKLTKAQTSYYNTQVNQLMYNYQKSFENGVRTTDDLPFYFNEIGKIIETMGIDPNSDLGVYLQGATFALLTLAGNQIKSPKYTRK